MTSPQDWSYETAFVRNRGLIAPEEQERLRTARVAIAGMGGVGGIDLVTLARLGIGRFTIADPDVFDVANFNRQYGAKISTLGRSKAEVMAHEVKEINPHADVRVFTTPLGDENIAEFLADADLFIDAIEFFAVDVRRRLFQQARRQGIHGITAGPVGFSGIWIVFSPQGMSADQYFDFSDAMSETEKAAAFLAGVAPRATQRPYVDMRSVNVKARVGPSSSLACNIASGAVACEAVKILLGRGEVRCAPWYQQFDPYRGRFARGRLIWGNRGPWQRFKRRKIVEFLENN